MNSRETNWVAWRRLAGAAPLTAVLALAACRDRDSARKVPDAPVRAASDPVGDGGDGGEASRIAGAVGGSAFTQVASAFLIDSPDSDAATVIYLLSRPARCIDLSFTGWDRALTRGTSVLEIELLGKAPGSFLAVTSPTLAPFEAAVEFERPSSDGFGTESRSTGGWVTLERLPPRGAATGRFNLDFGGDHLAGTFNASFCPGGHQP
jgi:hypothetical protein